MNAFFKIKPSYFKMIFCKWLLLGLFIFAFMPASAFAEGEEQQNLILDIDECNEDFSVTPQPGELAKKIVTCFELTVRQATWDMLQAFSDYMTPIATAMFTLAVIFFGIRILGGERGLKRKGAGFILRLGFIIIFYDNLGPIGLKLFDVSKDIICIVSGCAYEPWSAADGFISRMFGFGQHFTVANGILGLISASLFSSAIGFALFLIGGVVLLDIILFIINVIFAYLSSIVLIGFLTVISPFIIPLAIFGATERYFRRWADTLIAAILVPVLLFAFLQQFMGIFDTLTNRVFETLGIECNTEQAECPPADWSDFQKLNDPLFSNIMPFDPNMFYDLKEITNANTVGTPPVQSNINPLLRRALNSSVFNLPATNFGPPNTKIISQLILLFLEFFIFITLMKSIISRIPEVADSIVGAVSGISVQPLAIERQIKPIINQAKEAANAK